MNPRKLIWYQDTDKKNGMWVLEREDSRQIVPGNLGRGVRLYILLERCGSIPGFSQGETDWEETLDPLGFVEKTP